MSPFRLRGLLLIVLVPFALLVPSAGAAPTELFFSEYIEGSSNNKALEIYNGTGSGVNLAAGSYNIQMFFNGSASAGLTINLTGTVPAGEVFVVTNQSAATAIIAKADQVTTATNWFNGDDAVVLRKGGTVIDSIGQVGFDPGNEWGTGLVSTADNTLRRKGDVEAGDTNAADAFDPALQWDGFATDTFDGLGCAGTDECPVPPFGACLDDTASRIHTIQGSGAATPLPVRSQRVIEGVIVGDFDGTGGLDGYFVQEEDADRDVNAATSEGIFVAHASPTAVGALVRVRGTVFESGGMTSLGAVTGLEECSSGNSVTTTALSLPASAPTNDPAAFEPIEGMHVRLPQSLVISEYFNYDRFGEMVLGLPMPGETRHFTPTSILEPGAPAQARLDAYRQRRITLDDGLGIQNPGFTRHPNGAGFSLSNAFRGGDTVANTVGVMSWQFGLWRIQPTAPADYTAVNERPGPLESVDGIRVATMNTLNFFLTLDIEPNSPPSPLDNKCGPAQNVECRGADSNQPDEFKRQRDKLLQALAGLDGDVIGLNELENTTGVDPLGHATNGIVPGLNAMLGAGTYGYVDTGVIGTDAIRVGLIYRPGVVMPVGGFELLTTADDPRFRDNLNRPVLAQTFRVNATGERFTFAVNHLKSKGSDCNAVGDPDAGDGQGNCNGTRTLAAQALVDWLATDPTGSGDPDFLIMGDLNAYAREDPIDAVRAGPDDTARTADDYTNLVERYQGPFAYSFVFDGQAGYLDHGLASPTIADHVLGATEWHINADEPDLVDYDTSFKSPAQDAIYAPDQFRSADHDPLVVSLCAVFATCSERKLEVAADELEELFTSPRAHDKLEDVLEKVEKALGRLPDDRQGAAGEIEGAVGDLQAALRDRLLESTPANALLEQLTGAARLLAVDTIEKAETAGGNPAKIAEAETALAQGDARRAQDRFKDAVAKYKDAISKAEGAF